jgi:hypothetical protein
MELNRGTPSDKKLDEVQALIQNAHDLLSTVYNDEGIEEYHKAFLTMIAETQGKLITANALLRRRLYKK